MGINFGTEYKRFKREMEQKHKLYTKLGMSQEQIDALDEFDKEEFLSDNTYKRHVQSLSVDIDSEAAEDMHPLFKKFGDALSVELKVKFRDKYAWLDDISSQTLHEKLLLLSEDDLDILDAYVFGEMKSQGSSTTPNTPAPGSTIPSSMGIRLKKQRRQKQPDGATKL